MPAIRADVGPATLLQDEKQGMMVLLIFILAVVVASIWLATFVLALILPIRPDFIRMVSPLVCPPGTEMRIETEPGKRYRPGEKIISVYCEGLNHDRQDVKVKASFVLWGISVVFSMPIVIPILLLVFRWLMRSGIIENSLF